MTIIDIGIDCEIAYSERGEILKKVCTLAGINAIILKSGFNYHCGSRYLRPLYRYPQPWISRSPPSWSYQNIIFILRQELFVDFSNLVRDIGIMCCTEVLRFYIYDIVNIFKDDKLHLHCSWLDAVKTSKAQDGIRSHCRARIKESDTLSAYNILATLFVQTSAAMKVLVDKVELKDSIHKLPVQRDYYIETIHKVAEYMGTKEVRFWELLKKGYKKPLIKEIEHFKFFTNKPLDGVEFDYCCHPKVGDEIVAFYKDSKAIIHHKLCKKAYSKILDEEPMLHVSWRYAKLSRYRLIISLQNQKGILADLLTKLSDMDLNVISIELSIQSSESAEYCQIEVESSEGKKSLLAEKISQKLKLIEITSLDDAYNK